MPTIVTILEAQLDPGRENDLLAAYAQAGRDAFPPGLTGSRLLRATGDRNLWRIETTWASAEAIAAMRGTGTPRGILIFRAAGAEPALAMYEVAASLTPPRAP